MPSKLIDRKIIEEYISKTPEINGVADLLDALFEDKADSFWELIKLKKPKEGVVFHGSSEFFESVSQNVSTGGQNEDRHQALVYATGYADYAIFMGITKGSYYGTTAKLVNNEYVVVPYISPKYINRGGQIVDGFVYVLSKEGFTGKKWEYSSKNNMELLFILPVKFSDLRVEITLKDMTG